MVHLVEEQAKSVFLRNFTRVEPPIGFLALNISKYALWIGYLIMNYGRWSLNTWGQNRAWFELGFCTRRIVWNFVFRRFGSKRSISVRCLGRDFAHSKSLWLLLARNAFFEILRVSKTGPILASAKYKYVCGCNSTNYCFKEILMHLQKIFENLGEQQLPNKCYLLKYERNTSISRSVVWIWCCFLFQAFWTSTNFGFYYYYWPV